jgi:hypothetical protein
MTAAKRALLDDSAAVGEFLEAGEESLFGVSSGRSSTSRRQICQASIM